MTYYEVCNKYDLEKTSKGNNVLLNGISTRRLSNIKTSLKLRIRELDGRIDDLLSKKFTGTDGQIKAQELMRKRELTNLSDEEYYSKCILVKVEDELIRRKRNLNSVSRKALNNGGIYTTGILRIPRTGMGFKGYSGVCL